MLRTEALGGQLSSSLRKNLISFSFLNRDANGCKLVFRLRLGLISPLLFDDQLGQVAQIRLRIAIV